MENVVKIHYVKEYPKDDNFILSVDGYFCAVLNEQKFLAIGCVSVGKEER